MKNLQQAVAIEFSRGATVWRMVRKNNDLKALRDMISEAHDILRTVELPEQRSKRAHEILSASLHLADHLLETSPAATLGAKGGIETAKRGPEYFRKISAMRKEKKGGRSKPNWQAAVEAE